MLQKIAYSIEEEAINVISWRLKEKLNIDIKLDRLIIFEKDREAIEINIYGVYNDLCIIGDSTIDLRPGKIHELMSKVSELKRRYPEYLRSRILKVIYCMRYIPQVIEESKRYNIWILTWNQELTPMIIEQST